MTDAATDPVTDAVTDAAAPPAPGAATAPVAPVAPDGSTPPAGRSSRTREELGRRAPPSMTVTSPLS